jgi:hypothetical protein
MKTKSILIGLSCFTSMVACCQAYKGQLDLSKLPVPVLHYQEEYTFDTTLNPGAWRTQDRGLHVGLAPTDELYFRTEVPELEKQTATWSVTGWKGERLNAQILVWSPDSLQQVRVTVSDLQSSNGKLISKGHIQVHVVRYVVSNYPYGAKNGVCGEGPDKNLYLMPDRFETVDRFDLPGKTVRPIWISLNVPQQTRAGIYKGTIHVNSEHDHRAVQVQVTVQNQTLPPPHDWKHRLDLWQNPSIISHYYGVKEWSEDFKSLLKKHFQLYADAGGKFITANVVPAVWADETYGSLVEWIKRKDGTWTFDYNFFDQYVQLAMAAGVDKAITIYSPIPYGEAFRYLDEATGNYVNERWSPLSDTFKTNWNSFLTDLKIHLEKKGWFGKTYIGINENGPEQTMAAIKMVRAHSQQWKITYAGDWHPELDSLLNDYCFLYGKESGVDIVKRRSARGFTTTYYVCCTPPYPNNFVFSPPVEGRWISWYTLAHGYDGFLRWAYDSWPSDVLHDARNIHWTGEAGDCFIVYPGGNSSIRFEKLREGIVDFEKVRILRSKAAASANPVVKKLMQQLTDHLQVFLGEKDFNATKLTGDIEKGNKLVAELSDKLSGK